MTSESMQNLDKADYTLAVLSKTSNVAYQEVKVQLYKLSFLHTWQITGDLLVEIDGGLCIAAVARSIG